MCNIYLKPDFALKCMLENLTFTLNKHDLHERPPNEIILFWTKMNVGVWVPKFEFISRAPQNGFVSESLLIFDRISLNLHIIIPSAPKYIPQFFLFRAHQFCWIVQSILILEGNF